MAFVNRGTFKYHHPDWNPDSYWEFRAGKLTKDDLDAISDMTTTWVIGDLDEVELKRVQKRGEDVQEYVNKHMRAEIVMSSERATIIQMSLGWHGTEFMLPADYSEASDDDGKPIVHDEAGKVPPVTAHWIGLLDGSQVDDMMKVLRKVWAGRTPEQEKDLQEAMFRVAEPKRRSSAPDKIPVPATTE